jgi:hypothetical protein
MECILSSSDLNMLEEANIGCFPGETNYGCMEVLPGVMFGDIFILLYYSNYFDNEEAYDCSGDLVDLTVGEYYPYTLTDY